MNFLLLSRMASRASSCPASRPRPDYRAPSILDPKTDSLLTEQSISPRGPGATALPLLTAIAADYCRCCRLQSGNLHIYLLYIFSTTILLLFRVGQR